MVHTVKGFGIVNKAEIDVFLELSWFFDDPTDVGNLISGSSAFSKSSLNIWKFTVHVLLKPGLENFEPYFTSNSGLRGLQKLSKSETQRDSGMLNTSSTWEGGVPRGHGNSVSLLP